MKIAVIGCPKVLAAVIICQVRRPHGPHLGEDGEDSIDAADGTVMAEGEEVATLGQAVALHEGGRQKVAL